MNRTALITGASSGIGRELAYIHAEKGGQLIIVARREKKLLSLKKELETQYGVTVHTIAMDLSLTGSAQDLYNKIQDLGLKVDYLMNNAGFGQRGFFHELPLERMQAMMHLNMVSLTELCHLFIPDLLKSQEGRILNTSSTASYMPGPLQAVYFATKAYVTFLSNALAEELNGTGVSVTNLMPGATETEFAKASDMERTGLFEKSVSARSVAEDGYNGMMKAEIDVVSGLTFSQSMMMRMIPITPKKTLLKSVRKMQEAK